MLATSAASSSSRPATRGSVTGEGALLMNKPLSLALVVIGIVLLVMGLNASDSFASEVSEFFTNSPTDKAIWLVIGGVAALVVGGASLTRGKRA